MDYPADATFYVRLSLVNPLPGNEKRVSQIQDELLTFLIGKPGYVRGYKLTSGDPQGRIGRLGVWQSEAAAEAQANSAPVLSLRSEMLRLIEKDSHAEHSYTALDPQLAEGGASQRAARD